jgi:hypothetical protein
LIDRPRSKPVTALPLPPVQWKPASLRGVSGRLCLALDLVILSAVFLGIAIFPTLNRDHGGVWTFLRAGFSFRNAIVAVVCLCTWRMILMSFGMYAPTRSRSLADYIFRCLIGLNCCTVVIGFIELVLRTGVDVWRFMAVYWVACFAAMALARIVLFILSPADEG